MFASSFAIILSSTTSKLRANNRPCLLHDSVQSVGVLCFNAQQPRTKDGACSDPSCRLPSCALYEPVLMFEENWVPMMDSSRTQD